MVKRDEEDEDTRGSGGAGGRAGGRGGWAGGRRGGGTVSRSVSQRGHRVSSAISTGGRKAGQRQRQSQMGRGSRASAAVRLWRDGENSFWVQMGGAGTRTHCVEAGPKTWAGRSRRCVVVMAALAAAGHRSHRRRRRRHRAVLWWPTPVPRSESPSRGVQGSTGE